MNTDTLILDKLPANAPDGATSDWSAHVVLRDGSVVTREVASFDRTGTRVRLASDLDPMPLAGAMCVLESATAPATQWRVVSVRETGGLTRAFQARQYDPGRYAAVEAGLNLAAPATDTGSGPLPAPASVSLRERLYEDGGATRSALAVGIEDPAGGRDARVGGIDVQVRRTAGEDTGYRPLAFVEAGFAELPDARPGAYRARARYIARNGALRSPWTESAEFTVAGFAAPAVPAGVSVTALGGGYSVSWDAPAERDYAYTEILERSGQGAAEVAGRSAAAPWPRLGLEATERHVSVRHVDRTGRKTAASAESAVTPLQADIQAVQESATAAADSATEAADSATQAREAVSGIAGTVASEVNSKLDTTFAPAIALRTKTDDSTRLELASLADLGGTPSPAKIDAGALRLGSDFEVSDGRLGIADAGAQRRAAVGREQGHTRQQHHRHDRPLRRHALVRGDRRGRHRRSIALRVGAPDHNCGRHRRRHRIRQAQRRAKIQRRARRRPLHRGLLLALGQRADAVPSERHRRRHAARHAAVLPDGRQERRRERSPSSGLLTANRYSTAGPWGGRGNARPPRHQSAMQRQPRSCGHDGALNVSGHIQSGIGDVLLGHALVHRSPEDRRAGIVSGGARPRHHGQ